MAGRRLDGRCGAPDRLSCSVTRRPKPWIAAAVALALLGADLSRPPQRQVAAKLLVGAIEVYQGTLSRAMPALGVECRFTPTCSHYAVASIESRGALYGTVRALGRIGRCGPWTPAGTVDPP